MNLLNSKSVFKGRSGQTLSVLLALSIYIVFSLILFGFRGSWTKSYFGSAADPITYVWALNWWPFAFKHGLNPFISHYLWFPNGFNLTWRASLPFLALLGLPVTLIGGPLLTYNLFTILAPALSAWTAFLLSRYLTRNWAAAFIGGYLFGFSSYMLGQLVAHLNLDFTCLIPLIVLISLQRFRGDLKRRRFIVSLALLMWAQLGISTEIVATLSVFGAIAWLIFFIFAPEHDRLKLRSLAVDIIISGFATIILAAPFLFYLFKGLKEVPDVINSPEFYSADLLNYFIPTYVTRFGRTVFAPIANAFTGNYSEEGAYLGLPLIFLMALYFRDYIASRYVKALLVVTVVFIILSLGPWLHFSGSKIHIPLPWIVAERLPFIRSVLPTRFTMYVALFSAIVVALYLAIPTSRNERIWRFTLAILACLSLLPNTRALGWTAWPKQDFFTPTNVQKALGSHANVLIFPYGPIGPALAWQIDAGMSFTQSGQYFGFSPAGEKIWNLSILSEILMNTPWPTFRSDLSAFCYTHKINYILIGPGTSSTLINAIESLGWPQSMNHGVTIIQVHPVIPSAIKGVDK